MTYQESNEYDGGSATSDLENVFNVSYAPDERAKNERINDTSDYDERSEAGEFSLAQQSSPELSGFYSIETAARDRSRRNFYVKPGGSANSVLDRYLVDVSKYDLLTREEEIELGRRAQEGDTDARKKLILANLRLVIKFAGWYRNRGLDFEDLVQEGNLGLLRAAQLYDPSKGTRFSTYASIWVKQLISRAVDNKGRAVRLPVGLNRDIKAIRHLITAMEQLYGVGPSIEELSRQTHLSIPRVETALTNMDGILSLDHKTSSEFDRELGEQIAGYGASEVEFRTELFLSHRMLQKVLKELTKPQRKVVTMRYGLDGFEPRTFTDIAQSLGLSLDQVRELYFKAIKKMRQKFAASEQVPPAPPVKRGAYAI
jgi:RNA polymerase primary sigma factor